MITRAWYQFNAEGQILGRLATRIATLLMGKSKPDFATGRDIGDYVVVTNAEKIVVTGRKADQKIYYKHTGYPGGLHETTYERMMSKTPEKIIEKAVSGMLPKNKLRRDRLSRLKVLVGEENPYTQNILVPDSRKAENVEITLYSQSNVQ